MLLIQLNYFFDFSWWYTIGCSGRQVDCLFQVPVENLAHHRSMREEQNRFFKHWEHNNYQDTLENPRQISSSWHMPNMLTSYLLPARLLLGLKQLIMLIMLTNMSRWSRCWRHNTNCRWWEDSVVDSIDFFLFIAALIIHASFFSLIFLALSVF